MRTNQSLTHVCFPPENCSQETTSFSITSRRIFYFVTFDSHASFFTRLSHVRVRGFWPGTV